MSNSPGVPSALLIPTSTSGVEIKRADGTPGLFDIHVAPLIDDDSSLVGVAINFVDVTSAMHLRSELERLSQELQSHREELETTNEELQSTVEELETTNEELESTNAELNSINTDLQLRTSEVERLNKLLFAITGNIEVGAAVLDKS